MDAPRRTSERRRLTESLRDEAHRAGFGLFGVARPEASEHIHFYDAWVGRGLHGEMAYLARPDARARRADPSMSFPGVRSVVVVGHAYGADSGAPRPVSVGGPQEARSSRERGGRPSASTEPFSPDATIARYARGADYHDVIPDRLAQLLTWLDGRVEGGVRGRALVDTAPVLERELARRAGLGWFGRNTMLIHPRHGSYFLLGFLMVDVDLEPTGAFDPEHCGSCRACIEACPTGALLGRDDSGAPVIDARRCISYLTIELKGPMPPEFRRAIGTRVFGCDICQEVCPWNERFADPDGDPSYAPTRPAASLVEMAGRLLDMSEKGYQRAFEASPLARPRRKGMLRNLLVGLGNAVRDGDAVLRANALDVFATALDDAQPLVRGHAAWGLGQLREVIGRANPKGHPTDHPSALRPDELLAARLETEADPWVRDELRRALEGLEGPDPATPS